MQRVPLDSSLLQMIAMGLPDPRKFPFIEPPPVESIENSILSLKEHVCKIKKNAFYFNFNNRKYIVSKFVLINCRRP